MDKKPRSINWDSDEKKIFRMVIKPFINIIENKNLTSKTNRMKIKAWSEIIEQFNKHNKRERDKKQLMNQWRLTKLNYKKDFQKWNQTGCGQNPEFPGPEILDTMNMKLEVSEVDDCDGLLNVLLLGPSNVRPSSPDRPPSSPDQPASSSCQPHSFPDGSLPPSPTQPKPGSSHQYPANKGKKAKITENEEARSNYSKMTYEDMHYFRIEENKRLDREHNLRIESRIQENERLHREHNLRMETMTEAHKQLMVNLKTQQKILDFILENNCKKQSTKDNDEVM